MKSGVSRENREGWQVWSQSPQSDSVLRVDRCPFPLYQKSCAHRGEAGKLKVIAALTETLADAGAFAHQA